MQRLSATDLGTVEAARSVVANLRALFAGRHDAHGQVTLVAGVGATVVNDGRVGVTTRFNLCPRSASAAAEVATTYVSAQTTGQFTITHANNAVSDRTFDYTLAG